MLLRFIADKERAFSLAFRLFNVDEKPDGKRNSTRQEEAV